MVNKLRERRETHTKEENVVKKTLKTQEFTNLKFLFFVCFRFHFTA